MSELENKLIIGAKIKFGKNYCKDRPHRIAGSIITLIEGEFEYENGLYTETKFAPSIWDENAHEFDSIYHMFGNDLEEFSDCEIINHTGKDER